MVWVNRVVQTVSIVAVGWVLYLTLFGEEGAPLPAIVFAALTVFASVGTQVLVFRREDRS